MENIKNKIEKLLALASSSNEHEAKAALLKARELMTKYKIKECDVTEKNIEVIKKLTDITCTKRKNSWIVNLSDVIANNYCCGSYRNRKHGSKTSTIGFVGIGDDFEICVTIFRYAVDCALSNIKRLKKEYKNIYTNNYLNQMCEAYGYGFCEGVDRAFEKQNIQKQEYALVLVQPQAVSDVMNSMRAERYKAAELTTQDDKYFASLGVADGENFHPESRIKKN